MSPVGSKYTNGAAAMVYAALTATVVQVLPFDEKRRAIVISPPPAGTIQFGWDQTQGANPGIILAAGQYPFTISREQYGGMVTYPLFMSSPGGAQTVALAVEQWA